MSIFFEGIAGAIVDAAALVVFAVAAAKALADLTNAIPPLLLPLLLRVVVEPKSVAEAGAGGGAKKKKKASVDNRVVNPSSTKAPTEKAAAKPVVRKKKEKKAAAAAEERQRAVAEAEKAAAKAVVRKKKVTKAAAAAAEERQRAAAEAETGEEDEDYDSDGYQAAGRPAEKAVLGSLRRKKAVAKEAAEKGPSADVREEDEQEGNQEALAGWIRRTLLRSGIHYFSRASGGPPAPAPSDPSSSERGRGSQTHEPHWAVEGPVTRGNEPYPFAQNVYIADMRVAETVCEKMAGWPSSEDVRHDVLSPSGGRIRIVARDEAALAEEVKCVWQAVTKEVSKLR